MCNSFKKPAAKNLGEEVRIAPVGTGTGPHRILGATLSLLNQVGRLCSPYTDMIPIKF